MGHHKNKTKWYGYKQSIRSSVDSMDSDLMLRSINRMNIRIGNFVEIGDENKNPLLRRMVMYNPAIESINILSLTHSYTLKVRYRYGDKLESLTKMIKK